MATSSIFAQVVIDTPEAAERFINALEESEKAQKGKPPKVPDHEILRDKDEIRKFLLKRYTEDELIQDELIVGELEH